MSLASRIEAKYVPVPESGCYLWVGARSGDGYGSIAVDGKRLRAHRVAYELARGPIPEGLQLDHLCRVLCCVNPAHLEAVTPRENLLRGVNLAARRARQTHCWRGHEFTAANIYRRRGRPWRECRTCKRAAMRRRRDIVAATTKQVKPMPREPETGAIAVRQIPVEHIEGLQLIAKRDGITREELVRRLIAECVEKNCEPA